MYQEQQFSLPELKGLSAKQIDVHLKLYAGYVKNSNALLEKLAELKTDREKNALAIAELTRRFGFEFDGMRLHELYFEALGGDGNMNAGTLQTALAQQWGTIDAWLADFKATGMLRGIGWALLTYDAKAGIFHNVWVSDHELGHLAGIPIVLAMDVWEHAFLIDYVPAQRGEYIAAFLSNVKWDVCEARFTQAQ